MSEERSPEVQSFFDEIKEYLWNTVPNTMSGFLLVFLFNVILRDANSVEFMGSVAKTGVYVFCLTMMNYLGKASLFLVNDLISRITHEKEES